MGSWLSEVMTTWGPDKRRSWQHERMSIKSSWQLLDVMRPFFCLDLSLLSSSMVLTKECMTAWGHAIRREIKQQIITIAWFAWWRDAGMQINSFVMKSLEFQNDGWNTRSPWKDCRNNRSSWNGSLCNSRSCEKTVVTTGHHEKTVGTTGHHAKTVGTTGCHDKTVVTTGHHEKTVGITGHYEKTVGITVKYEKTVGTTGQYEKTVGTTGLSEK